MNENNTKKDVEDKIRLFDNMDYNVKSLAIGLLPRFDNNELKFVSIDSEYDKIKMDTPQGSYYINKELGEYVEYESVDKTFIKKFKVN